MLKIKNLHVSVNDKPVLKGLNLEVKAGEVHAIMGPNGAGKTTIIKMIMGQEKLNEGEIFIGPNIKVGYYSQVQSELDMEETVQEEFLKKTGCYIGHSFGYLKNFLFERDALKKKIKHLSPGERARFAFSIFAYKDYDLLILDEPDNHLDIETKEVIEKSLNEYKGTVLLVSHDRYFVEEVGVNKILNLKDGTLESCE